jgi:hypothetical protein
MISIVKYLFEFDSDTISQGVKKITQGHFGEKVYDSLHPNMKDVETDSKFYVAKKIAKARQEPVLDQKIAERNFHNALSHNTAPSIHMSRSGEELSRYKKQIDDERFEDFANKAGSYINSIQKNTIRINK